MQGLNTFIGGLIGAVITAALGGFLPGDAVAADTTSSALMKTSPSPRKVFVARLEDEMINPVTAQFLCEAIDRAEAENAVVIIQLDTPGGLLQSTREIVKRELTARVPVVVYVAPPGARAASAGVFITLASHVAAMAPGTNIGAAHVVDVTGSWPVRDRLFDAATTASLVTGARPIVDPREVMSEKIMNDTLAWVEAIAQVRGRNAAWARETVEKSISVTASRAVELHAVDLIAENLDDLLTRLDGRQVQIDSQSRTLHTRGAVVEVLTLSESQRILNVLANPNVALLLLLLGLILLGYEVAHPGVWIPGVTGIICLLLAALALKMLPTNYAAILLILLGIGLLIAEIKITSYGLLTVFGAICIFFGALAMFQQPRPFIGVTLSFIAPLVLVIVGLVLLLVYLVTRSQLRTPATGVESFAGKTAEVIRPLQPEGKVFFNGTYWDAVWKGVGNPSARVVRIVGMAGMKLIVEPMDEAETLEREAGRS